jgi:acetyl-CoA carboxylase carboxyltransferase component
LQSCYNNDTKTEERQKNAKQTKEEETTSKKVHEKQEVTQRTRIEAGIEDASSAINALTVP